MSVGESEVRFTGEVSGALRKYDREADGADDARSVLIMSVR